DPRDKPAGQYGSCLCAPHPPRRRVRAPRRGGRRIIWRRAIAALAGESRAAELASLLDALADQHELTAAQIKNAMLTARYAAMREGGPINAEQIRRGLGRELIKDGRPANAPARATRIRLG